MPSRKPDTGEAIALATGMATTKPAVKRPRQRFGNQ